MNKPLLPLCGIGFVVTLPRHFEFEAARGEGWRSLTVAPTGKAVWLLIAAALAAVMARANLARLSLIST